MSRFTTTVIAMVMAGGISAMMAVSCTTATVGAAGTGSASTGLAGTGPSGIAPASSASVDSGPATGDVSGSTGGGPTVSQTTEGVARAYPLHTDVVATTFWVGEIFDPQASDGSQVISTYDSQWLAHYC